LIIKHANESAPPQFQLVRSGDGKFTEPVTIPSPRGYPVEGMPNSELMKELRWYLEVFLDYPYPPFTDRAERILAALRSWGIAAFNALFGGRQTARLFDAATSHQYSDLHLEIASDDPAILHWPWEALEDPEVGVLSQTCRISRRLHNVRDPAKIPDELPKDVINILLVTARPYESDVQFRSISRPLVDLIVRQQFPATVTLLRPPTVTQLREHLTAHPNHYHILHFDGHGSYGTAMAPPLSVHQLTMKAPEGRLIFEDASGKPDPQSASVLSQILLEHRIPVAVLNACQSAMVDDAADDAFASVAAGLQKAGIRSVVAMAYSLYVSAAQQFLPAFYQRLFETGDAAEAIRVGRQQTLLNPDRVCARGRFPLADWLVPVLYHQESVDLRFQTGAAARPETQQPSPLPAEARDDRNPYGFIGRDGAVLALERAWHRPAAGILIHGLGGIGKTTLARGFLRWLAETNGLQNGCFWLSFQGIRSAESVFNELVGTLFGTQALAASNEEKLARLVAVLRHNAFVIVWDNFEDVRGFADESIPPGMAESDQRLLAEFLQRLRGGKTKVLITSRSSEDWLDQTACFRLPIRGLSGEERWEFCDAIVRDFGLTVDRMQPDWKDLIEELGGHPLAMRVVLSRLNSLTPRQMLLELARNPEEFARNDLESAKLFATLRTVQTALPEELKSWLIPLSFHERFVDAHNLKIMGKILTPGRANFDAEVNRLMQLLCAAGVISGGGQNIYELHPALSRYLQQQMQNSESPAMVKAWQTSFTDVMGALAQLVTDKQFHEQRTVFAVHRANFLRALQLARDLEMDADQAALTQSLGVFARNSRRLGEATELFRKLVEYASAADNQNGLAFTYHQLGIIAREQRDFATAEQWYRKSLAIFEKQGNEHGAAGTYHQLGIIAREQRDFATAEQWYRKSLAISEKQSNERVAASTYHELGLIAQEHRDFATAEQWYRKSLAISEKQSNEHGAADAYHQLGSIANEYRDFATAEQWYRKSLAIAEKEGDEHGAATTYHQLGVIAYEQRDFATAEQWYRKSLAISEKQANEHGAAGAYHQLGVLAHQQSDFSTAEQWYRKSLAISEKQANEHGAATTYHQLGVLAHEQSDFATAEMWYRKSLAIQGKQGNEHGAAGVYHQLGVLAHEQSDILTAEQLYRKSLAISEKQANEHEAASTYRQLGCLHMDAGKHIEAAGYFLKAFLLFERTETRYAQLAKEHFRLCFTASTEPEKQALRQLWRDACHTEFPEGETE
jgi:tetratricopeptide (TPR) repeat protein